MLLFLFFLSKKYYTFLTKQRKLHHLKEIRAQRAILNHSITAQEMERQRIARDLHDAVVSKLNLISLWLQHPEAQDHQSILDELERLIENTRNLSHNLYPYQLSQFGLINSLNEYIYNVNQTIPCVFNIEQEAKELNINTAVSIYRIITEFINNSIKYSQAKQITIALNIGKEQAKLVCKDDGIGMEIKKESYGMGMNNIDIRAQSMNAQIKWSSQPNQGVQLELKFKP